MKEILSVSALNDRIKALLEEGFALVWVEGEVSNLRRPASGHIYFTLKDAKSQIRAVIFRNPFAQRGWSRPAGFAIEEGMSVVCRARLTVYPPRGEYQLIIDAVEPQGSGRPPEGLRTAQGPPRGGRALRSGPQEAPPLPARAASASSPRRPAP